MRASQLNPSSVLKSNFIPTNSKKFVDKNKEPGLCLEGRFSNIGEIDKLCEEYDVYIYSLFIVPRYGSDTKEYLMCYGCREKSSNKFGMALHKNHLSKF